MDIFSLAGAVFTTPEKLVLIPAILVFFFTLLIWRKSVWLALLSTIILFLPFNSSLRLDFGLFRELYDPYIYNIEVNYLVPTLYLSDFLFLLTILTLAYSYFTKNRDRLMSWLYGHNLRDLLKNIFSIKNPFVITILFGIYAIFHLSMHPEFLVFLSISRLFVFVGIINFLLILNPASLRSAILKNSTFIILTIGFSALLQLSVASQQIIGGTEVGLYILGEPSLEAGRKGVSFVSGFGSLFLRGYGTFPHPNVLGAYLVAVGIISLLTRLLSEIGEKRINTANSVLYLLTTAIITCAIALTFSRSAFIVWCLALLLFIFRKQFGKVYESALSLLRRLKLPKPNSNNYSFGIMNLFGGLFGARESSVSERLSQYLIGIEIFKSNFLLGVGAGSYALGVSEISSDLYYENLIKSGISILQPSHNIFLTFLAEHGVIGAIIVLFVLLTVAMVYLKHFNVIKQLSVFIAIIPFAVFVFASLDHYLYTLPIGLAIGLVMLTSIWGVFQARKKSLKSE
jgi:O-antigen ligase